MIAFALLWTEVPEAVGAGMVNLGAAASGTISGAIVTTPAGLFILVSPAASRAYPEIAPAKASNKTVAIAALIFVFIAATSIATSSPR